MKNKWIIDGEEVLLESPFIRILKRKCHAFAEADEARRKEHTFYVMDSRDWTNIIPITADGKVVMIRQDRAGIDDFTLEIPGGVIDPGEDPQKAALRELSEETGYEPAGPECRFQDLGWSYPNPAILNNRCHLSIVGPVALRNEQRLDEGEMIEVVEIPIEDVPVMIQQGKINHALILNGFLKLLMEAKADQALLRDKMQAFSRAP